MTYILACITTLIDKNVGLIGGMAYKECKKEYH